MSGTVTKTFEYKLRASRAFIASAEQVLSSCQKLYNACLEQRISHYLYTGKSPSMIDQSRELTDLRKTDSDFSAIPRVFHTDVLKRLERAYAGFFSRMKSGKKPGFPRFRPFSRYNCFEWTVDTRRPCPLRGDKVVVPGIGQCRVRLSRVIEGVVKRARILRKPDGWHVQFVCEIVKPTPLQKTGKVVGVDVGLTVFAALSTGEIIANPGILKTYQDRLAKAGRKLSRRKRLSVRRMKAKQLLAKHHQRIVRARKHFHHQVANRLVRDFDEIHVEQLNIKGLVRNPVLSKAILDVAWNTFFQIVSNKAEWAGRTFLKKVSKFTSQTCSTCGEKQKMSLAQRIYFCQGCGLLEDRDVNASKNILKAEIAFQARNPENVKRRVSLLTKKAHA